MGYNTESRSGSSNYLINFNPFYDQFNSFNLSRSILISMEVLDIIYYHPKGRDYMHEIWAQQISPIDLPYTAQYASTADKKE